MKQSRKKKKHSFLVWVVPSVLILAVILVVGMNNNKTIRTDTAAIVKNTPVTVKNTTSNSAATSPTQSGEGSTAGNTGPIPVKPVLSKSSGNNGPVPVGATINFTCTGAVGDTCKIIIDDSGKQIVLDPKEIRDNGRGQAFADFYWTAARGSYQVVAQVKNSVGNINNSLSQALEVQ